MRARPPPRKLRPVPPVRYVAGACDALPGPTVMFASPRTVLREKCSSILTTTSSLHRDAVLRRNLVGPGALEEDSAVEAERSGLWVDRLDRAERTVIPQRWWCGLPCRARCVRGQGSPRRRRRPGPRSARGRDDEDVGSRSGGREKPERCQLAAFSRTCTPQAEPRPITCARPTFAPSIWRSPASPRRWWQTSQMFAMPVAAIG